MQTTNGIVEEVYLDNAATTPPFRAVDSAVRDFLSTYGSVHRGAGRSSRISTEAYEAAREKIRAFVGGSEQDYVIFTKNTTEAINNAAALWSRIPGKILVSDIEHSSNLLPWLQHNTVVQYKTKGDGTFSIDDVTDAFRKNRRGKQRIKLLAVTGCSNVTGYKPNIHGLAEIAHRHGAKILVDACQLIPHQKVDIHPQESEKHLDFIAFSGHKMYAPYGAGVLIGPKEFFDRQLPYQIGGGNISYISRGLRPGIIPGVRVHEPGTPNAVGAIAIAAAVGVIEQVGYEVIQEHESALAKKMIDGLDEIGGVDVFLPNGVWESVIPFDVLGMDHRLVGEVLREDYGISVRTGNFCAYELMRKYKGTFNKEDMAIMREVKRGITKNIPGVVRASVGLENSLQDIVRFVHAVEEVSRVGWIGYESGYQQDEKSGQWRKREHANKR